MTIYGRLRASVLCALIAVSAAGAATPARAAIRGANLAQGVTELIPIDGGSVFVDDVRPFQPWGGIAVFEPQTERSEVFTYQGVEPTTKELTGVVRTDPSSHQYGSFVQAVRDTRPSPSPSPSPSESPRPHGKPSSAPSASPRPRPSGRPSPGSIRGDKQKRPKSGFQKAEELAPQPRSFDTSHLTAAASELGALGWSEARITKVLYRPFPVAGATIFTNTWGAVRYGPAPGQVRGHEGQDLFCDFGTPLVAVTAGRIQFDTNGLGGRIARLHTRGGSYWYYAHLSGWNRAEFNSGDRVEPGDVIGYCGHSGDAKTTPNHLHFGWYTKDGKAHNPMGALLSWLKIANRKAGALVKQAKRHAARTMGVQMTARMFGDSWAPDLTVVPAQSPSPTPSISLPADPAPSASSPRCTPASPPGTDVAPAPLADCLAPAVPVTATDGS